MTMIADASTIKKLKSMVASKDAQVEALNGRIEVLMDDLVEARAERDHIRTTCFRLEDVVRQCQQEAEELEERATAAEERAAAARAQRQAAQTAAEAAERTGASAAARLHGARRAEAAAREEAEGRGRQLDLATREARAAESRRQTLLRQLGVEES